MSIIRAVGYGMKDAEDDAAFQMLVTDVQRLKQELRMGSTSGAGGTDVGGPVTTTPTTTPTTTSNLYAVAAIGGSSSASGVDTTQSFSTVYDLSGGAWNGTTYTIPVAGSYLATSTMDVLNATVSQTLALFIAKNGVETYSQGVAATGSAGDLVSVTSCRLLVCNAGEAVTVYIRQTNSTAAARTPSGDFTIFKIPA